MQASEHEYLMEGNQRKEIYNFYAKELPANGWEREPDIISVWENPEVGNLNISVLYGDGKEIRFQSEKGTKLMKPESQFFPLTNLPK